ncbi:Tbp-1 [Culex quinquefasciatus]|uniref:Tbp-1 n=1 Tax=Culex quinquefasciatus TaxID=7176 RepID=B0XEP5_CULQU|nr:Tbp-1 [Culex quinquefasciatus]|eukprot:XP_001868117.1 Tbp-1 [Culex quinquefasciatus]
MAVTLEDKSVELLDGVRRAVLVLDSYRKGKRIVIKTSTRQKYFLPMIGLVDPEKLKQGDLVSVNKDSYLILETLPAEYDVRVKTMEVDERPTEQYSDIGGLDRRAADAAQGQVQEPGNSSAEGGAACCWLINNIYLDIYDIYQIFTEINQMRYGSTLCPTPCLPHTSSSSLPVHAFRAPFSPLCRRRCSFLLSSTLFRRSAKGVASTMNPIYSAPGSHTFYDKIPPYLHEHPRDCPRWTMTIGRLLTEVTGLDSSEADGLPQKICVVDKQQLMQALLLNGNGRTQQQRSKRQNNLDEERRQLDEAENYSLSMMITVEPMLRLLNRAWRST